MVPLQIPEKAEDKSGADRGGSGLLCGMCLSMGAHAAIHLLSRWSHSLVLSPPSLAVPVKKGAGRWAVQVCRTGLACHLHQKLSLLAQRGMTNTMGFSHH